MDNEKFCPILMIGFDPPIDDKIPDMRLCNPGCAWYDEVEDQCSVLSISSNIFDLIDYTCAASNGNYADYGDI